MFQSLLKNPPQHHSFLFNQVLKKPMGDLGEFAESRRPRKLLVVLSCDKMRNVLQQLRGKHPQQCHHWVQGL